MKQPATNKELLECIKLCRLAIKLCRLARKYIPVGTYNGTSHVVTLLNLLPELLDDLERHITERRSARASLASSQRQSRTLKGAIRRA